MDLIKKPAAVVILVAVLATGASAQPFPAHNDYSLAHAKASSSIVLPLLVTVGTIDQKGKVPALNKVAGAGVDNFDVALPLGVITHGQQYVVSMVTQNVKYSGKCTTSYAIEQSAGGSVSVVQSAFIKKDFKCQPGEVWVWFIETQKIPNITGQMTLVGTVQYGSNQASLNIPIVIE